MRDKYWFACITLVLYIFLALFITYPLINNLGTLTTGYGDELVIAWIQNWVIHNLSTGSINSIFNANTFYPYNNTLAYSDLFITSSILSSVPLIFIKEPIVVINFTFITSLFLLGFSIYILSFYITKDFLASLLSGTLVMFSPAVLDKTTHLQILTIYWVPISILFFLHFFRTYKARYLTASLICFLLQAYNSFLPAYFIVISYGAILFVLFLFEKKVLYRALTKKNIFICVVFFLLLVPIIIPYYKVSNEFTYVRDIRDTIHFALQPEDLTYPSQHTLLQDYLRNLPWNKVSQNDEFKPGYIGLVFSILIIFTFLYYFFHMRKHMKELHSFFLIASTGIILSFGPVLHLGRHTIHDPFPIPLPYILFYYIAPGFQGFRNSARWEMLFILAMAVLIAICISQVSKGFAYPMKFFMYAVLIVGCIAEYNYPLRYKSVPSVIQPPKIYQWLSTTPQKSSVIILPLYNWNMWPGTQRELWRQYYGTIHFRRTVNGYSGFSPPPWQKSLVYLNEHFPDELSLQHLRKQEIDYIVIDKTAYRQDHGGKQLKVILAYLEQNPLIRKVVEFPDHVVFQYEN